MTHNLKMSPHSKPNITPNYSICLVELGKCFSSLVKTSIIPENFVPGRRLGNKEFSAL